MMSDAFKPFPRTADELLAELVSMYPADAAIGPLMMGDYISATRAAAQTQLVEYLLSWREESAALALGAGDD